MQSPGDSNCGHRSPLNRGEEDASKRIADGQAKPTFKGLRKELAVCAGQRFQLALQSLWLLEALKLLNHQNLPRPPLFGVQRNNQLFLHGDGDLLPGWDRSDNPFHVGRIKLQPARQRSPLRSFESCLDCRQFTALEPYFDGLTWTNPIGRNICLSPIHEDMTVGNQDSRLCAGCGKSEAMYNAVQPLLQNLDKILACDSLLSLGQMKVFPELSFQHPRDSAHLLLFTKLFTVVGNLRPSLAMYAGNVVALLNRTLDRKASIPFQKQLQPLSSAKLAHGIPIPSHEPLLPRG